MPQTLNGVSFSSRSELKLCLAGGGGGLGRVGREKSAVFVFKNEPPGSNLEQMAIDSGSATQQVLHGIGKRRRGSGLPC